MAKILSAVTRDNVEIEVSGETNADKTSGAKKTATTKEEGEVNSVFR